MRLVGLVEVPVAPSFFSACDEMSLVSHLRKSCFIRGSVSRFAEVSLCYFPRVPFSSARVCAFILLATLMTAAVDFTVSGVDLFSHLDLLISFDVC